MTKAPKKKRVQRAKMEEIELHPDAWERFEKGIKQIAGKKQSIESKHKK